MDYIISQGLFIKLLALCYLCAFLSLLAQVKGLYGSTGITPIANQIAQIKKIYNKNAFRLVPTLFLINSSDRCLYLIVWIGVIASFLCMLGIYPAIFFIVMWLIYFSFYNVGAPFLNYQWDVLLLETGIIGFLYAIQSPPSPLLTYLLWFFLFRFMFSSGYTKLAWGSKEWKDLTAMNYHYETQPLPTKLGYYLHHQPIWFSKASVIGIYFFEIIVPFFIFGTDTMRVIACILMIALQLMIIATGNYAFFNILSITLCIPLLSDNDLKGFEYLAQFSPIFGENTTILIILSAIASGLLFLNALEFISLFVHVNYCKKILLPFQQFCCAVPYGLFVHMTTFRDEIIIEGSDDGKTWKEYEFKWKPGNLSISPKLVAPHQPRLDWQMWFASLTTYHRIPWFESFLVQLLEGPSDPVASLLKHNPFPNTPPKYIRAHRYRYHFTNLADKRKTGHWWKRTDLGPYSPTLSLKNN